MDLNIMCLALVGAIAVFIVAIWLIDWVLAIAGFVCSMIVERIKDKIDAKNARKDWDKWFEEHPEFERTF